MNNAAITIEFYERDDSYTNPDYYKVINYQLLIEFDESFEWSVDGIYDDNRIFVDVRRDEGIYTGGERVNEGVAPERYEFDFVQLPTVGDNLAEVKRRLTQHPALWLQRFVDFL